MTTTRSLAALLTCVGLATLGACGTTASGTPTPGASSVAGAPASGRGGGVSAGVRPAPIDLQPGALAIVAGAHAGAPAPALGTVSGPIAEAAVEAGMPVTVVENDGTPTATTVNTPPLDTSSDLSREVSVKRATEAVIEAVRTARPDSDHANPLEAVLVAASSLPPGGSTRGTVLVLDNLLSDTGIINTSRPGVLSADPKAVAADVTKKSPGVSLAGVNVVLSGGIGATLAPQKPLTTSQATHLVQIYAQTLESLGATVYIDPTPRTQLVKIDTTRVVKLTPVPTVIEFTPPTPGHTETILLTEAQVRFQSDSDAYADADAASASLAPIADWLKGDPARRSITLTGTTSSAGDEAGRQTRSTGRATTVRATLIQMGVAPSQVTKVNGVGMHFNRFIKDRDTAGNLIEGRAARNRLVILTLSQAAS